MPTSPHESFNFQPCSPLPVQPHGLRWKGEGPHILRRWVVWRSGQTPTPAWFYTRTKSGGRESRAVLAFWKAVSGSLKRVSVACFPRVLAVDGMRFQRHWFFANQFVSGVLLPVVSQSEWLLQYVGRFGSVGAGRCSLDQLTIIPAIGWLEDAKADRATRSPLMNSAEGKIPQRLSSKAIPITFGEFRLSDLVCRTIEKTTTTEVPSRPFG